MKTILYFGNIDLELSRNKIYIEGLRQNGVEVLFCVDRSKRIKKYWNLYKKHKEMKGKYDVLIVGYGGYVTVPLAKMLSDKPVIFDALCSFYETEILSRDALKEIPFRMLFVRFVDCIATRFADKILVESNKQKEYFSRELKVKSEKLVTVYTGVEDSVFKIDESIEKYEKFTVLFRGRIMSEAGVPIIIKAAKLLENENIDFRIIGHGSNEVMREFEEVLKEENPKNVTYVGKQLPFEELVYMMQKCHVSLGQFAKHERLERTIPHKAFESLALKLPYITARAGGVIEILEEDKHCLFVEADNPNELAQAILNCKNTKSLRDTLAKEGFELYKSRFSPQQVVVPLCALLK
jgi:glycosyltransferase involved in cell wall biosynthesis